MSNEMINEAGVIPNTVGEITVIFEDTQSREEAVRICDQLMARFWSNHPLDVEWWSFADLEDPRRFREASVRSARSDVLIFAVRPESELPAGVRHWIESWVTQRRDREGA